MAIRKTRKVGGRRHRRKHHTRKHKKHTRRHRRKHRRRRRGGSVGSLLSRAAVPLGLTYLATRKRRKRGGRKGKRGGNPPCVGSECV